MKFFDFEKKYGKYPLIKSAFFELEEKNIKYMRRLISEWVKKKWLIKLKSGFYIINKDYYLHNISKFFIANELYSPSYISLEIALSYYNLIPEGVYTITSVSTKKTMNIHNDFGVFSYSSIKKDLFFGYSFIKDDKHKTLFAYPEKALLDFLYINIASISEKDDIISKYRFQNIERLNKSLLKQYLKKFGIIKLENIVNNILNNQDNYKRI